MCGAAIEPDEAGGLIEAVEVVPAAGFGAPGDTAEGNKALFHKDCFPEGDPRYKRIREL
jgi:hypothetical protein